MRCKRESPVARKGEDGETVPTELLVQGVRAWVKRGGQMQRCRGHMGDRHENCTVCISMQSLNSLAGLPPTPSKVQ